MYVYKYTISFILHIKCSGDSPGIDISCHVVFVIYIDNCCHMSIAKHRAKIRILIILFSIIVTKSHKRGLIMKSLNKWLYRKIWLLLFCWTKMTLLLSLDLKLKIIFYKAFYYSREKQIMESFLSERNQIIFYPIK